MSVNNDNFSLALVGVRVQLKLITPTEFQTDKKFIIYKIDIDKIIFISFYHLCYLTK